MTVREIQGHLAELYGTEVSPDLISKVTDAILDEVREWQSRPLEAIYPVVFFDALRVKIRDEGMVKNKAVYVVLGITASGEKDVLGLWIEQTEGATFWLKVMNDLRNRGVADILIVDSNEAGHAFQFEAGRVFRSEAGHPWRRSHGSIS
ncbi:transposase-like protein [Bradyrhizobium sp. USDA 241]